MPFGYSVSHAFSTRSILAHAPVACGVYGITNSREWIFIGQAYNIQAKLLEHSSETDTLLRRRQPAGFVYEVCDPSGCPTRRDRLIREYKPVANPLAQE